MVCPMRFVLVGVSAVVALCVAFWALQEHEEIVGGEGKGDPRKRSKCGRVSHYVSCFVCVSDVGR